MLKFTQSFKKSKKSGTVTFGTDTFLRLFGFLSNKRKKVSVPKVSVPLLLAIFFWAMPVKAVDYLAVGDMRGYVEPCGCDPKTDMGGLQRMKSVLDRERSLNPKLFLISLGNNFSPRDGDLDQVKNKFIERGLKELKVDIALANVTELKSKKKLDAFYISSGQEKTLKNVVFYGFVEESKNPVKFSIKKGLKKVLLFSGSDQKLEELQKKYKFDEIISSNKAPIEKEPGKDEKENENLLSRGGIFMTPLGGQGFLRGGKLLEGEALPLAALLSGAKPAQGKKITWLTNDQLNEESLGKLMVDYKQDLKKLSERQSNSRADDLKTTNFAGADACKSCHAPEYEIWKKSSHFHAFDTLKGKKQNENPECVSCHVVGHSEKGGFVSEKLSPQFAGVQCENCHGARKDHTTNPSIRSKTDAKNACVSCHKTPHSSSFIFEDYWKKIMHGKKK